jgi:hypothetical protein
VIIRGRWNASGVGGGVRSRPKGVICVFVVVVVGGGGGKGMGAGVCACGRVGKVKSRERIKERVQRGKGVTGTRAAVVQLGGSSRGEGRKRNRMKKQISRPERRRQALRQHEWARRIERREVGRGTWDVGWGEQGSGSFPAVQQEAEAARVCSVQSVLAGGTLYRAGVQGCACSKPTASHGGRDKRQRQAAATRQAHATAAQVSSHLAGRRRQCL